MSRYEDLQPRDLRGIAGGEDMQEAAISRRWSRSNVMLMIRLPAAVRALGRDAVAAGEVGGLLARRAKVLVG